MLKDVRYSGFDHADHALFAHGHGFRAHAPVDARRYRENRKLIQSYLYRIQLRLDRGATSGAIYLFNRLLTLIDAERWIMLALRDELTVPTSLRA